MSKFKVGDVVRRINFNNTGLKVGHLYTIAEDPTLSSVHIRGHGGGFDACNFELVERAGENKPHPHAELMAQYAEDAKETDKPWERWEVLGNNGYSIMLLSHPTWHPSVVYRRKPSTININGYEVPEPVRVLQGGETYYCPYIGTGRQELDIAQWRHGSGFIVPRHLVEMGLVHTTREAAELHAKALLSFTNGKG